MEETPSAGLLAVVVAGGVVVPGVSNYALHEAGYPSLGTLVFAVGYGTMALLVWFGWLRHLELTGPAD